MRLPVFFILLVSTYTFAQQESGQRTARAPQGEIKYSDATGAKVNWRYLLPENQWKSQLESFQRAHRSEAQTAQAQQPSQYQSPQYQAAHAPTAAYQSLLRQAVPQPRQQAQPATQSELIQQQPAPVKQPAPAQNIYKSFSSVPASIKQLILETYKPQRPYVDSSAFVYNLAFAEPQGYDQQPATAEYAASQYEEPKQSYQQDQYKLQSRRDYGETGNQGKILYKEAYAQQQQQLQQQQLQQQQLQQRQLQEQQHQQQQQQRQQQQQQPQEEQVYQISVPVQSVPLPPIPRLALNKGMPTEIQQLLQYQAQLPYDVTANRITFTPKQPFIPKALSDDIKGPYYYRSKVYYMENGEVQPDFESSKPVEEKERH